MKLTIEISDEKDPMRILIDGKVVPLVKECVLTAHADAPPLLSVRLAEVPKVKHLKSTESDRRVRARIATILAETRDLLRRCPYIELLGKHDTLPSGMSVMRAVAEDTEKES